MDEADAYSRLLTEFKLTQQEISKKVGKSRSTIANALRLLDLPQEIKKALRKDEITSGHARALLAIEDKEKLMLVFRDILKNKLSVRDIEILVYGSQRTKEKKKRKVIEVKNVELKPFIEQLSSHLGTKVAIRGTTARGRIEIEYYSQEDLERLLEMITNVKMTPKEEVTTYVG